MVPGKVGAIAIRGEGQLLAAVGTELGMLDFTTGDYEPWKPVEPGDTGNRLNDGRCDPVGRFWVGSMYDPTSARIRSGHLHRTDASGDQLTLLDDVGVANGLAFSPDGTTMYFADTFDRTVWTFDYDVDTGIPSNQRVFLDMGDLPGKPDGACVDEEGGYWLACVRGGALIRVLPSGTVERSIELPVSSPTMCAFGGTEPGCALRHLDRDGRRAALRQPVGDRPGGPGTARAVVWNRRRRRVFSLMDQSAIRRCVRG